MINIIHEPTFHVNSSSNHYFFWSPEKDYYDDLDWEHFGWSGTVSSEELKILYATAQLEDLLKEEEIVELFNSFGIPLNTHPEFKNWKKYSVDHQSRISFRTRHNGKVNLNRFEKFFFMLMQPNAGIFLSNDNGGNENIFTPKRGWMYEVDDDDFTRKIDKFDYRFVKLPCVDGQPTGFKAVSKMCGAYEVYFGDHQDKLVNPEAIDIKITNKCKKGCKFCYQSSTQDGVHADFDRIKTLAKAMGENGVLQAAIGGGEPTLWTAPKKDGEYYAKDFCNVLRAFSDNNVLPSFSTGSLQWTSIDKYKVENILMNCGGISYSVTNKEEAKDWAEEVDNLRSFNIYNHPVYSANIIPEIIEQEELIKIIQILGKEQIHILFLGFKQCGNAKELNISLNKNWTNVIETAKLFKIILSADSVMAERYPSLFNTRGPAQIPVEGQRTMYIDAVEWKSGRCSYDGKLEDIASEEWKDIIKNFPYTKEEKKK